MGDAMKRRSRAAGGEPTKGRRRKTLEPKRRDAPKIEIRSKPSPVAKGKEVARLVRERDEAVEQQTATSEVLRVISASPGDLELVFQAMLERAVRLCEAKFGNIYRWDGEALHILASHNTPPAFADAVRRSPYRPYPQSPIGRMVADRSVAHIPDVATEEVYLAQRDPVALSAVALGGIRTLLGVPLLNKGEMFGAFFLSRREVRPFTEKQIALVKNFAAQAVIAIENARLLNELRQRTTDLPVENPALQAVLMALEMRDAIGALTETWRRLGHEIGFGIGIAHGFATLGTIGFEGRFDYAAIGTVSNVASRLCDEAKPGQILISPRVLMKVENAVKVEPVGEFELKGIRRPLAADMWWGRRRHRHEATRFRLLLFRQAHLEQPLKNNFRFLDPGSIPFDGQLGI
jgi:class 3 adenylate cyclase